MDVGRVYGDSSDVAAVVGQDVGRGSRWTLELFDDHTRSRWLPNKRMAWLEQVLEALRDSTQALSRLGHGTVMVGSPDSPVGTTGQYGG